MEHFRATFATQDADVSVPVVFAGYASVFNVLIDSHILSVILPGSFGKLLKEQWDRIKILWQHDSTQPIGRPLELYEDSRGLFLRAVLSSTPQGQQVARLVKERIITEMSIGFDVVSYYYDRSGPEPVRYITEARLWEVSLVTFAANKAALVTDVQTRPVTLDEHLLALECQQKALDIRSRPTKAFLDEVLCHNMALELDLIKLQVEFVDILAKNP